jgi:transposase
MTLLPSGVKMHLALGFIDMRKGIDGLAMLVQGVLRQDPFSGHLFVFRSRTRANLIKIIHWDGTGLCLFTKRLKHGVFLWPPNINPDETLSLTSARLGLDDLIADLARAGSRIESKVPSPQPRTERASLPSYLEREEVRLDLDRQARSCCGGHLHLIGETISEMLDHVPARLRMIRICRPRYGCRSCRSPRTSPALLCLLTFASPNTAITCRYTDRASLRSAGRGARRSPTGLAAPVGGWSRSRQGSPSTSSAFAGCHKFDNPCTKRHRHDLSPRFQ